MMTLEQLKEGYRDAWLQFCEELDRDKRQELMVLMDLLQPPDLKDRDEWQAFTDTLPGFREFWNPITQAELALANLRERYS